MREDGWTVWEGAEHHHLSPTTFVEVRFRDGFGSIGTVGCLQWEHIGDHTDITAYRVVEY